MMQTEYDANKSSGTRGISLKNVPKLGSVWSTRRHQQVTFPSENSWLPYYNGSTNLTVKSSLGHITAKELPDLPPHQDLEPERVDDDIDKWFFVRSDYN
jgi:hypothetical protein